MRKIINPAGIAPPASAYHHGLLTTPVTSLLTLSGQLGVRPDGSRPADAEAQARLAWDNVQAILTDAGMDLGAVVKVTSYIVGR